MSALYSDNDLRDSETGRQIGKCVFYFEEDGNIDMTLPRLSSNAILDTGKDNFKRIVVSGAVQKNDKSRWAENYRFFLDRIAEFKAKTPDNLWQLAARLLNNVFVVNMFANSADQAIQLFQTNNDRGMSLRITDIFLSVIYDHVRRENGDAESQVFLDSWKKLDERCNALFGAKTADDLSPLEFLFLLYALTKDIHITGRTLKHFYDRNNYALLKAPQTLKDIESLLDFLTDMHSIKRSGLFHDSERVKRNAYILFQCNTNVAWKLLTAFYFKQRSAGKIDHEQLAAFLERCIAFFVSSVIAGEIYKFARQQQILHFLPQLLSGEINDVAKIDASTVKNNMNHFYEVTGNQRGRTFILVWWTFKNENQKLMPWDTNLTTEHIFATKLAAQREMQSQSNVNLLGNLALLEKKLNSKAQNFTFTDKIKTYQKSAIEDLKTLAAEQDDFTEADILKRNEQMINEVLAFLAKTNLLAR